MTAIAYVVALVAIMVVGSLVYLRRVEMEVPPIGVFNRRDIYVITGLLSVLPFVYGSLPTWVLVVVQCLVGVTVLGFTFDGVLGGWSNWVVAVGFVALDAMLAPAVLGSSTPAFHLVNNVLVVIAVIGVANLYVQSGLQAADVALFAFLITIYDVFATIVTTAMVDLFNRVMDIPFAPALLWDSGDMLVGIGAGDLLVIAAWALVCEKAFGRHRWRIAAATGVGAAFLMLAAFLVGVLTDPLPAMIVLGPLVTLQYLWFRRSRAEDRTMSEYRGRDHEQFGSAGVDDLALAMLSNGQLGDDACPRWVAIRDGAVVAEAETMRELAAKGLGEPMPVVVWTSHDHTSSD